jgi:ribose 5-phosphate isomerase A
MAKLKAMGCVDPQLRMGGSAKAGPCITDNGNFIIDADFGQIASPADLESKLCAIPGILETGLFVNMACKAYFGMEDGTVSIR